MSQNPYMVEGGGADMPRDEALAIVQQEGMLLVLTSLVENMPNVIAEASVLDIPFLVCPAPTSWRFLYNFSTMREMCKDVTLHKYVDVKTVINVM